MLKKDDDTGASDVAIDPSNPHIVFAGFWQARRLPWDLTSGGPGSGLYVSRDGGDTWKQLTGQRPARRHLGQGRRRGRAVGRPARLRADRSREGRAVPLGRRRRELGAGQARSRALRQRAWYYSTLTVNPHEPERRLVPAGAAAADIDGGKTFKYVKGIAARRPPRRLDRPDEPAADDRRQRRRRGHHAERRRDVVRAAAADLAVLPRVASTTGRRTASPARCRTSAPRRGRATACTGGIHLADWHDVGGGEAGYVVSDPSDPNIVYAGEYLGIITRYDHRTRRVAQRQRLAREPVGPRRRGHEVPLPVDRADRGVAARPEGRLPRRATCSSAPRDGGQTWDVISPDLTRNDKTKQKWAGGPITGDNTGVEIYCTIFAIAESPKQKGLIWAGSDDGLVHVTRDGGKNWTNVTAAMPGLPEWGTVS